MFNNYKYEKPDFIAKKNTDALTASFAGGGWLHLNENIQTNKPVEKKFLYPHKKAELQ